MTSAVTARDDLAAWIAFLRAHAAVTRQLNTDLQNAHGLTLSDYEVLVRLEQADGGFMRRVDLAESVFLTASGITRLLEGLEQAGYVEKGSCPSDARVSYAKLTDDGRRRLVLARKTHLRGVEKLFNGRFTDGELGSLEELLSRLPVAGGNCSGSST